MFTVVLIVRDEEQHLPGALASLGPVPDLVVCDTGSRDATAELARAAGARVVHHPWHDDFAEARAFAESHAEHEWIFRFDADERFTTTQAHQGLSLREWLAPHLSRAEEAGAGQVFVRRLYAPGNEHWFPRLHRRGLYRWRYPVHELLQPVTGGWPPSIAAPGALLLHERTARPRPYRRLLEAAVAIEPDDPYLLYHLGRAYTEEQDFPAADSWLRRYLQGPPGYRFHRSEAWMLLGQCRATLDDAEGAFRAYEEASRQGPRAEPLWHAALLARARGDLTRARTYVERGRALSPPRERQPFGQDDHPYLLDMRLYQAAAWEGLAREMASRGRGG